MNPVPDVVVSRLPLYLRDLTQLQAQGSEVVSSRELGTRLGVTPAQIRKDLSYFGRFGRQGRGYNIRYLIQELRQVLGLDREWNTALVGVGRLGRAILNYPGFRTQGFHIVAAFDSNPEAVGQRMSDLVVQSMSELEEAIRSRAVDIVILAVPATQAQTVVDRLAKCAVRAILNYAPVRVQTPREMQVRDIDPVLALQSMTFYLKTATQD